MWGDGGAYGAWVSYMAAFGRDDAYVLASPPAVVEADFHPETWGRWVAVVDAGIGARLALWQHRLVEAMKHARTDGEYAHVLVGSRTGLRAVLAFVTDMPAPFDIRERFRTRIESQIRSMQADLERDALARVQTQQGERELRIVRANPFTAVIGAPLPRPDHGAHPTSMPGRRRPRIIG